MIALVQQAKEFLTLWQTLMPTVDSPEHEQFVLWLSLYPEHLVTRGVSRTAAKTRSMARSNTAMSTDDAAKYASSVMKHEMQGNRRHQKHQAPSQGVRAIAQKGTECLPQYS